MKEEILCIQRIIGNEWISRSVRVDWLGLENLIREIYSLAGADATTELKLELIREALAAFTRRG